VHNREAAPAPSTVVDLRAIYKALYDTLPWPEPIPAPTQVIFKWSRHVGRQLGSCRRTAKVITVNPLYHDQRLRGDLDHLMAHEASHFIWPGHPKAFKDFLRRVGVAAEYINGQTRTSETFQAVEAEWLFRQRLASPTSLRSLRRRRLLRQINFLFDD
jgi:hypothetical protein